MSTPRRRRASSRDSVRRPPHRNVHIEPWRPARSRSGFTQTFPDQRWARVVVWSMIVAAVMTAGALALDISFLGGGTGSGVEVSPEPGDLSASATSIEGDGGVASAVLRTFDAVADAYVNSEKPDFNYGDAMTLRVDQDPEVRSYLAFEVHGLNGAVQKATIDLFVTSASSQGFLVQPLPPDATWSESSIDHLAAPQPLADDTKTVPPFAQQTWIHVDVTDLITGDGRYGFALSGISRTAVSMGSRESDRAPQLTIEVASEE